MGVALDEVTKVGNIVSSVKAYLSHKSQFRNALKGISTGYADLDCYTNGLNGGIFAILGSVKKIGETAFALNLALNVSYSGKAVLVFVSENKTSMRLRMLSIVSGEDSQSLRQGLPEQSLQKAFEVLEESNIYLDDTPLLSIEEIKERIAACQGKSDGNLRLVILDSEILGIKAEDLKAIAKSLDISILLLTECSSSEDQEKPSMSRLCLQLDVARAADLIMLLHRDGYYRHCNEDVAKLAIVKNVEGPLGTIELHFEHRNLRFISTRFSRSMKWLSR